MSWDDWSNTATCTTPDTEGIPYDADPLACMRSACNRIRKFTGDRPDCFLFMAKTWNEILNSRDIRAVDDAVGVLFGIQVYVAMSVEEYRTLKYRLRYREGLKVCVIDEDEKGATIKLLPAVVVVSELFSGLTNDFLPTSRRFRP